MSQTWKIIIAVIVTAIIAGGGVYYFQKNKTETDKWATIVYKNAK